MTEQVAEQAPQDQQGQGEQPEGEPQEGAAKEPETFDAEYVAKLRKESAKYRTEAKSSAAELDKFRQQSMTEAERNIAEAEARGRTAAATEFGKRLARTEFDALAARRNAGVDTSAVLEYVDLARFVDDSGEPDSKALSDAVERLVPAPAGTSAPSFDGGGRTSVQPSTGMNDFIRKAAGRG